MHEGIFGIIDFHRKVEIQPSLIQSLGSLFLAKEGLDIRTNEHFLLGMRRHTEGVPCRDNIAQSSDFQILALICGEVHNYDSLKRDFLPCNGNCNGDLNLFLHLFSTLGIDFAKKLNGLFSLAILNKQESSISILNDRFGMAHQVYWLLLNSRFYFATHLKILALISGMSREIDFEGLNLFLKYSYIPSPWTIFKGIRKLPPGHLLVFRDGKVTVNPYWEFIVSAGDNGDFQEAILKYKGLLKGSIAKRLNPNGKTGILLSGGLDSSANVALAVESTDRKLLTFAVGFCDPFFDERPYAKIIAQRFNTEHYETVVTGDEIEDLPKLIWHLEEPYFEFGLFLTYIGLASARERVDIVIGGEGADQLFGTGGFTGGRPAALHYLLRKYQLLGLGKQATKAINGAYFYDHDNIAFKLRMLWDRAIDLNNWYFYGYDQHELLKLYRDPRLANIPKIFPDHLVTHNSQPATRNMSFPEFFLQTQINQDLKHYVNENVMVKSGRMADMLDLTLRESYLDTEVTDFLVSLEYSLKRSGSLLDHLRGNIKTKLLHRKAMEKLLPSEVMTKPKQGGFVPVMIFLKKPELRNTIYNHLLNSKIIREYFNTYPLKHLFENYERVQGKEIYWHNFYNSKANRILFLLTFDIWHHFYIKNNSLQVSPPSLSDYLKA